MGAAEALGGAQIVWRAVVGSAAVNEDPVDVGFRRSLRILEGRRFIIELIIPIGDPLRDIPGHVVNAVGTPPLLEGADRRAVFETVVFAAAVRQLCVEIISPRISLAVFSPCRLLPFRFGRKTFARPFTIR